MPFVRTCRTNDCRVVKLAFLGREKLRVTFLQFYYVNSYRQLGSPRHLSFFFFFSSNFVTSRIWWIFFQKLAKLVKISIQNKRIPKTSQLVLNILSKCQQFCFLFWKKNTARFYFIFLIISNLWHNWSGNHP